MDEKPQYFKTPGEDGLVMPGGMAIDDDRDQLLRVQFGKGGH